MKFERMSRLLSEGAKQQSYIYWKFKRNKNAIEALKNDKELLNSLLKKDEKKTPLQSGRKLVDRDTISSFETILSNCPERIVTAINNLQKYYYVTIEFGKNKETIGIKIIPSEPDENGKVEPHGIFLQNGIERGTGMPTPLAQAMIQFNSNLGDFKNSL